MKFQDIDTVINASGLRLVIVRGLPSPWSQAAKAMIEYKGLEYMLGSQMPGVENAELETWSGENSAPIVAWNDEAPLNRWNDILLLLERLAPERPLIPADFDQRNLCFGLGHELCGEDGFGWNRRLDIFHHMVEAGGSAEGAPAKYGYTEKTGPAAKARVDQFLDDLTSLLDSQKRVGSEYFIGDSVTAVDFYWTALSNLICLQPDEQCPLDPGVRAMFEGASAAYGHFVNSPLIAHRDRIMERYFKQPMQL